jgi:hypothetical protein
MMFLNVCERLACFVLRCRVFLRRIFGWVDRHPIEVAALFELVHALRRGESQKLGAKILGTCSERDVVRVRLADGRLVEVPVECLEGSECE